MTQQQTHPAAPDPSPVRHSGWAAGGTVFAGVLMLMDGILAILQGISAIAADDVYRRFGDYIYKVDLTGWGWILIGLGIVVAITGAGVLKGMAWARVTGIVLASLSMIAHIMFLPYNPIWSLIMVGIDFFVIWSLASYHPNGPTAHARADAPRPGPASPHSDPGTVRPDPATPQPERPVT
ncbi:hypothetical protein ACIPRD_29790 [Streptomyces sp. NPDC090108]|uniref:DUF7144 family membrane protein n=1 Tax=Streptomyces sp. NPDC090108 TaxID=3365947 RepID=UPI003814D92F